MWFDWLRVRGYITVIAPELENTKLEHITSTPVVVFRLRHPPVAKRGYTYLYNLEKALTVSFSLLDFPICVVIVSLIFWVDFPLHGDLYFATYSHNATVNLRKYYLE